MKLSECPRAQWYISKQFWRQINLQYDQLRFFRGLLIQWSASAVCHSLSYINRPLGQKFIQSSSLLRYFNCFLSNHTVGCWNINFNFLSQIKRKKICFASNVSIFLLYFFAWLQLFRCHVWPTFHPATPKFFVLAQLFILIACWKTTFFLMFMGN